MDKPAPWHSYGSHIALLPGNEVHEDRIRQDTAITTLKHMLKVGEDLNRYAFEFVTKPATGMMPKTVAFKATLIEETMTEDERISWKAYESYQREQMKKEHSNG